MDPSLSNFTTMDATECSTPMNLLSARERDCVWRERKRRRQREQERRRTEQTEVRQARLDRQRVCGHERRAAEQPAARQTRLATDRQRIHERRVAADHDTVLTFNKALTMEIIEIAVEVQCICIAVQISLFYPTQLCVGRTIMQH